MKKSMFITTIIMVVVLIVALSTATYAWFTVGGAVTTEEVQFTAVTTENLEISLTALDADFGKSVTMEWAPENRIWPVSLTQLPYGNEANPIAEWVFGAGEAEVDSWAFIENNETVGEPITIAGNYLVEELYLRSFGAMSVYLNTDSFVEPAAQAVNMNGAIDRDLIAGAVRIGIFDETNTLIQVWAPNADIKFDRPNNFTVGRDGTYENNTADTSYTDSFWSNTGSTLVDTEGVAAQMHIIDLEPGVAQKITVLVWIEGNDAESDTIFAGGIFNVGLSFTGTEIVEP